MTATDGATSSAVGTTQLAGVHRSGILIAPGRVQGPEEFSCFLYVKVRELTKVIVDGLNLGEVVHGNSGIKVNGKIVGRKDAAALTTSATGP
jgi:hypothetical protein